MHLLLALRDIHQPLFIANLKELTGQVLIVIECSFIELTCMFFCENDKLILIPFHLTGEEPVAYRLPFLWTSISDI